MPVEPPDFYFHRSPLGVAVCDDCNWKWPCHLAAWGDMSHPVRCNICGGDVWWSTP